MDIFDDNINDIIERLGKMILTHHSLRRQPGGIHLPKRVRELRKDVGISGISEYRCMCFNKHKCIQHTF